ncbi:MAG: 1-deoxy-D-xylulose-5-phosphate reductoisomerase [Planctomycetes bacterium]|nr:1-deoxy-D-xylulose-5-phosphate reductoisomerase [Planctomycetota bacterium]MCW8134394.1 1-deoxy-D-xylulose-5-phosphate reductoisomerase [Planctomycetota bacterium]
MARTRILLLGASGSIGASTLDVVRQHADKFEITGMSAGRRYLQLLDAVREFRPAVACICDPQAAIEARGAVEELKSKVKTEWRFDGAHAMAELARELDYDVLLASVTGAAGLPAVLEAAKRGKRIALANKESLVMTGPILTAICKQTGAELLPVDSEHSAIFQCLRGENRAEVKRIILTASGGPFRTTPIAELENVTVQQALKHPTWQMGPKITIDSSTLFNKALEVIEARWLFDVPRSRLDAVIHPQSVVHSMVEFVDASIIAHLGPTDMKIPIQFALSYPARIAQPVPTWPWEKMATLTFEPVDYKRFPALELGFEVAEAGGTLGAVFNAANEIAVERFLAGDIGYLDIYRTVAKACEAHSNIAQPDLDQVLAADKWAREQARS